MAFIPKTWVGRSVEHPGRIKLIPTGEDGVFDVQRAEGEVTNEGDLVSDGNLNGLEGRIYNALLLSELIAAGLAEGTDGAANNALALGGIAAANYPQMSSGTWTPSLTGEAVSGSPTYSDRRGDWIRQGNMVDLFFSLSLSSRGGMSGVLQVSGVPFVSAVRSSGVVGAMLNTAYSDATLCALHIDSPDGNNLAIHVKIARPGSVPWVSTASDITDTFIMSNCHIRYKIEG